MRINIVPLIDVFFAVLTFFVMSTLFLTRSEGLSVNLPAAQNASALQKPVRVTLSLDAQGRSFIDRETIASDQLAAALVIRQQREPNLFFISVFHFCFPFLFFISVCHFNADGKLSREQFVTELDQIKALPGLKVAIATKRN